MKTKNKVIEPSNNNFSPYTKDPPASGFHFLGLKPAILGRIVHLGWPVIVGMLTQTAINTIDVLMVGRLDDAQAVPGIAAIMASVVLLWAYGGFLSSISVGTQALSARRFSEGKTKKAGQVLTNSLMVASLSSLVLTAVAIYLIKPTMAFLTQSPEVQDIGSQYSQIRLLGLPSMALMASFKSFYDGIGRVRVHMCIAIFMNLINFICNYFLIFGFETSFLSVAPLGVYGAAWGSVISSYAGVLIILWWSLRKKERSRFEVFKFKNLSKAIALSISKLSVWSGLATVVLMVGVGLFNHIVSIIDINKNSGTINASAASIILHVMMLVFMTSLAFGTSTATLVSQSIGAKKPKLAEQYAWQCVLLAVYIMAIFGLITFLFPKPILALFIPPDLDANHLKELVIETATPALKMCALLLSPTAAAGLVLTQALYGAGETRYIMIVEFLLHFLCLVPLTWVLAIYFDFGILGCWIAAIVYAGGLLIATSVKFLSGSWKKLVL